MRKPFSSFHERLSARFRCGRLLREHSRVGRRYRRDERGVRGGVLFTFSALMGLANSAFSLTVPKPKAA